MPNAVNMTTQCTCSMGTGPSPIRGTVAPTVMIENQVAITALDNTTANVGPFINCISMANPTVASATAAAQGVLTPMPCIPMIVTPWTPGSANVKICNQAAVHIGCTLSCAYGGIITIAAPVAVKTMVT